MHIGLKVEGRGKLQDRNFKSAFDSDFLADYQAGVMSYQYKGVKCLKSPIDIAIYMQLIWNLQPKLIIEIGSMHGGSALLLSDITTSYGLNCPIYSIDITPPQMEGKANVKFLEGDVLNIAELIEEHRIEELPHPWLVIEDSAHSYEGCLSTLNTFSKGMISGDILVVEDGILDELGLSERYKGGPNRAIREFLSNNPNEFGILPNYCDMFGRNATYNPNGYLVKL